MEASRGGRIGVITSVAGERGRPRNYTYGTAKGALNVYLQGLRSRLYDSGVSVTTLKLGPVDTPMTKDHAKHALFGKPSAVARGIVRALDARTPEAIRPFVLAGDHAHRARRTREFVPADFVLIGALTPGSPSRIGAAKSA